MEAIQQEYNQERFAEALRACLEVRAAVRERGDENAARICVGWLTDERNLLLEGCRAAVAAGDEDLLGYLSKALAEGGVLSVSLDYFCWPGAADRARAVYAAARAALVRRSVGSHPPEAWQPELARWIAEAVARYNGAEPPLFQGRWCDDVPEYLRALKAEHSDWLVGPVHELILFFQTGAWPSAGSSVRVTVPLDDRADGILAGLRVCRVSNNFGEFYPDPATLLFVRWDRTFAEATRMAWEEYGNQWRKKQPRADVRWRLEPFRNEQAAWLRCSLAGPSAGAAMGVGLRCLLTTESTPPDDAWAVTGQLLDATGHLGSVGGYGCKTVPFARYPDLRLVVPTGDRVKCPADWRKRIEEAETVERAYAIATGPVRDVVRALIRGNLPWTSLRREEDTGPLLEALETAQGRKRLAIIAVLGWSGDNRAVVKLGELVNHPDRSVRKAAAEALRRLVGVKWVRFVRPTKRIDGRGFSRRTRR